MLIKTMVRKTEPVPRATNAAAEQVYLIGERPERSGLLESVLRQTSLNLSNYPSAEQFLFDISAGDRGVVVTEAALPGMSGIDLHRCLTERGIDMPVIVLACEGDIPTAVRALEAGALDCMEEPVQALVLVHKVRDAMNRYRT